MTNTQDYNSLKEHNTETLDATDSSATKINVFPSINGHIESKEQLKGNSQLRLGDFCIDEPRPIKVVVIGAGYSGM